MSWLPVRWAPHASEAESSMSTVSSGLRVAGILLRTVFIMAVLAVTARVALPQNETIWTAYETPGDLVRMALGLVVCVWVVFQLFSVPKDAHAYRTWIYLGLAAVPFAVYCAFAIW
jgi:hypothetical protein